MVSIGISDEKRTEITTGLDEKESIVVMGQEMLKDNQKVKITGTPKKAVK
jgi:hypothetical protein